MRQRFDGRVVLVTGAAAGIGRVVAQEFAAEGANVVVADIDQNGGEDTVALIGEAGGSAAFVAADVGDSSQADAMVEAAVNAFGGLDIVHANAGVDGPNCSFVDHEDAIIERVVRVNLVGVIHTCRAAIPRLEERGGGVIVITSSRVAGQVPVGMSVYAATKAGLNKLTEALALEYGPRNIRVNAVAPGVTMTEIFQVLVNQRPALQAYYEHLTPLGRWATPHDIAQAVKFLASEEAAFITGVTLTVDGGLNLRQADVALQEAMTRLGEW